MMLLGVFQQYKAVASGDRALCKWACQPASGWQQMWLDHQEGCWLYSCQGTFTLWFIAAWCYASTVL